MFTIALFTHKPHELRALSHCVSVSHQYDQSTLRSSFLSQATMRKTAWQISSANNLKIVAALDLMRKEVAFITSNRALHTNSDYEILKALLIHLIKASSDYLIETLQVNCTHRYQDQFKALGFAQKISKSHANKQNSTHIQLVQDLRPHWGQYHKQIQQHLNVLNIPCSYACQHAFPIQAEAQDLIDIGQDVYQRPQKLSTQAAPHWHRLKDAATKDGIELQLVSAFRSVDYQAQIVQRKQNQGLSLADILQASAAPGFSEHHTGRAVDLNTEHCAVLEEEFATTEAYAWLKSNAHRYGFVESFPKNNAHQLCWEPWHWSWNSECR